MFALPPHNNFVNNSFLSIAYTCSTSMPYLSLMISSAFDLNSTIGGKSAGMSSVAQTSRGLFYLVETPNFSIAPRQANESFPYDNDKTYCVFGSLFYPRGKKIFPTRICCSPAHAFTTGCRCFTRISTSWLLAFVKLQSCSLNQISCLLCEVFSFSFLRIRGTPTNHHSTHNSHTYHSERSLQKYRMSLSIA